MRLTRWRAAVFLGAALSVVACQTTTSKRSAPPSNEAKAPTLPPAVVVESAPVVVDTALVPDAEVEQMLAPLAAQVAAQANVVVGELSAPLERGKPESSMGNFATDAMRTGVLELTGRKVDVCFTNAGGLRINLPAGPITEGMIVELMPFDNAVVVMEMNGERFLKMMETLAARGDPASGVRYRRVDGKATEVEIGGAPVDLNKTYSVCTNDYVYEGGSQYDLSDVKKADYTGILLRDVFRHGFTRLHKEGRSVVPNLDGRVKQ